MSKGPAMMGRRLSGDSTLDVASRATCTDAPHQATGEGATQTLRTKLSRQCRENQTACLSETRRCRGQCEQQVLGCPTATWISHSPSMPCIPQPVHDRTWVHLPGHGSPDGVCLPHGGLGAAVAGCQHP